MIRAIATGTLFNEPQARTSAAGNSFVTAKLKADGKDSAVVWCNLIAFAETAERLARLPRGAALSVAGRIEIDAYISKTGGAAASLKFVVDELATLKGKPRQKRPERAEHQEYQEPAAPDAPPGYYDEEFNPACAEREVETAAPADS